jgi:hypothetical protein
MGNYGRLCDTAMERLLNHYHLKSERKKYICICVVCVYIY